MIRSNFSCCGARRTPAPIRWALWLTLAAMGAAAIASSAAAQTPAAAPLRVERAR